MEQTSFFDLYSDAESFYEKIVKPTLFRVISNNFIDDQESVIFQKRKSYYSVLFLTGSTIMRIYSKPELSISIPTTLLPDWSNYSFPVLNGEKGFTKISVIPEECPINYIISLITSVMQNIIDRLPKDFDCCSRYLECSNAKKCIHPDKEMRLKCGYRKILRKGTIFYGENRNID